MIRLSDLEPIPDGERIPGGPTHRVKAALGLPEPPREAKPAEASRPAPNQTETEAMTLLKSLPGVLSQAKFEGYEFRLYTGIYTPDWVDEAARVAVEVKGNFIRNKDSRVRFNMAKGMYPDWTWIWMRKYKGGHWGSHWRIEIYTPDMNRENVKRCHA
jgi:hypothetical protein